MAGYENLFENLCLPETVERTKTNNNNLKKKLHEKHNCYLNYGAVITTV